MRAILSLLVAVFVLLVGGSFIYAIMHWHWVAIAFIGAAVLSCVWALIHSVMYDEGEQ